MATKKLKVKTTPPEILNVDHGDNSLPKDMTQSQI